MTLGKRIQRARKKKGYTQKQLAEICGVATGTIQQYELGKRQPRIEQLEKIAESLEISVQNLITQGSIVTEMNFDNDEEATLYLDIMANLEKMNIEGVKETKRYTNYIVSDNKYTS